MRKILSILVMLIGIGIFMYGNSISQKANKGASKVAQAEETQEEKRKPLVGPVRKTLREQASETAEKKISVAKQKVVKKEVTADWLHGTGIAVFVVGLGCFIYDIARKKKDES